MASSVKTCDLSQNDAVAAGNSRTLAEGLIKAGRVTVNGMVVTADKMGMRVSNDDEVSGDEVIKLEYKFAETIGSCRWHPVASC
jgi:16S rRNA U516 pseudouridylate synthase RsuA-like enzyme